jgi:hypothetical protein
MSCVESCRRLYGRAVRESNRGQTANEMLMIMGLLTAMIISVTGIVLPTIGFVVERLTKHLLIYVGSP